jgi:hypothetical protein
MQRQLHPINPPEAIESMVATWFFEDRASHPIWYQYAASVIHLRDILGMQSPVRYFPEATHELVIFALNPAYRLGPTSEFHEFQKALMSPVNICVQFRAYSDDAARERIEDLLKTAPSVDSDFRLWWRSRLNGATPSDYPR